MANIIGVDIDSLDQVTDAPAGSWLIVRVDGVDKKIKKSDLSSQTSEAASIDLWDADAIYNTTDNKYAESGNRLWRSKQNDNQGHEPPSDPEVIQDDWWVEVSPSEPSSLKEWRQGIYTADEVVVKYEGNLVELVNSTRPFESVDILVEIAAGDWRYLPENKADKKPGVSEDNIWVSDGSGGLKDSGVPISSVGSGGGSSLETYADIPAMLADQANQVDKQLFEVTDASKDHPAAGQGDPTIDQAGTKGWYRYKGVANGLLSDYVKVSEEEAFTENEVPDMPALSVKANPTNISSAPQDVAASTAERLFARTGSNTLAFIQATTNMIADLCVTGAKIAANAVGFDKFVQSTGNTVVAKIGAGTSDFVQTPIINIYDGLPQILSMRELSVDTLLDNGDCAVDLDCSSGAVVAQLDDPVTVPGQVFIIMKIDSSANVGTVDPQTYTINGSTTDISLSNQFDYIKIRSTGSEYVKIGGNV